MRNECCCCCFFFFIFILPFVFAVVFWLVCFPSESIYKLKRPVHTHRENKNQNNNNAINKRKPDSDARNIIFSHLFRECVSIEIIKMCMCTCKKNAHVWFLTSMFLVCVFVRKLRFSCYFLIFVTFHLECKFFLFSSYFFIFSVSCRFNIAYCFMLIMCLASFSDLTSIAHVRIIRNKLADELSFYVPLKIQK